MDEPREEEAVALSFLTRVAMGVLDVVREEPGCNLTDAMARSGLGRRAFAIALDELLEGHLVHRLVVGRESILLPDLPGLDDCLEQIAVLRDVHIYQLYQYLCGHELCPHRDIVGHASHAWGWEVEATRWRLRRLEKAELAQAVVDLQDRRCVTYRSLPAHPRVHEILAGDL